MKKILSKLREQWNYLHSSKILTAMRNIIILICLTAIQLVAADSYAQKTRLSIEMDNASVEAVLNEIENQSEFFFLYNSKLVDVERKVDVKIQKEKISKFLNALFSETDVKYMVMDRQIILSSKKVMNGSSVKLKKKSNKLQIQDFSRINNIEISGSVKDEDGMPLIGATVLIKGTGIGTITDLEGRYSIEVPDEKAVLVFSYIGYAPQEVVVGSQTRIDLQMLMDAAQLEEVVVIGYGTMKKKDLTGSVAKVNIDELAEMPNVSVIQAMQGTVAGLNVGAVDQAGENPSLSIRGQNSLSSGGSANAPLIVVDGTIFRGNLVDLNTADIESVDILKDASSAAIYGSQASNGVMLITTKKGRTESKPIINYRGSYSVQTPGSHSLESMGRDELTNIIREAYWENGSRIGPDYLQENPDFTVGDKLATVDMMNGFESGIDNSMWDLISKNGFINKHSLSVRGRTKTFGYFFSGGITDVEGYIMNDKYRKYNYRINLDATINKWMNVGMETFLASSDYSGASVSSSRAFNIHPWTPLYDDNGKALTLIQKAQLNPLLEAELDDSDKRLNLFANIHADIKLPVKGLTYRINFSQNYRTSSHDHFNEYAENFQGSGYKYSAITYDYTVDNILTYKKTFNDVHNINATLVYGVEKRESSTTNASAQIFTDDLLGYHALELGDPTLRGINTGAWQEQSLYTMARAFYNYDNRYLITGTVRRDGFSGFGTETKIGVFPSVALGWVASEERFIKDNLAALNYLKIRASYGQTGRRAVGRYDTHARISTSPDIIFGDGGSVTTAQWISTMANNDLGWETTTGLNLGVDFAMFNSRLHGNIEYYKNHTNDILYNIKIPNMTGFSSIKTNIGEVANHGLEFTLNGTVIKTRDFSWKASVNFSRNRNEIVSILGKDDDGDGIEDDLVENQLFIGEPTDVIYDYEIIGIWQLADREDGSLPPGFFPGTYMLADLSGPEGEADGIITSTDDRKIIGYKDPAYRMGISNTFKYKGFRLHVFINTIQGGKDYYYGVDAIPDHTKLERFSYQNWPAGGWDYWMPENTDARFRRLDLEGQYEPNRYMQRNFIRLQDVSLSYTFDKGLISKLNMSSLKVFASGKNLATITKWRGWDPETGRGFVTGGIPLMTSFTFGVNVEF